jgi:hypothetical protein
VSVHFERKVLQCVAVSYRVCGIGLGQIEDTWVLALSAVVLDNTLANLGHMEQAVKKVRCPVEICGAVRDVVAEHAHSLERTANFIRQIANHSLRGAVGPAPVTGPSYSKSTCVRQGAQRVHTWQAAVAINVVAAEEDIRLFTVGNLAEPP